MANSTLFRSKSQSRKQPNRTNAAGGKTFYQGDEHALCQYVVTGTFANSYYASAKEQLDKVKNLCRNASSDLLARAAVYGHENARMKDVPAFLLAVLASRRENVLLERVFPRVITNVKMLLNFVQIIRSGVTGRKSFGSAVKRMIGNWITSRNAKQLLIASIGHSNPSLYDVIKMVHPRPVDEAQNDVFKYLLGHLKYDGKVWTDKDGEQWSQVLVGDTIQEFEDFKHDNTNPVPDIPFRALTNCGLTTSHWSDIAQNMPWNTLRMNLNTLDRNGVFNDRHLTRRLAEKLADADEVRKWNAFPYQLLTAYQNTRDVPTEIQNALQDAMEVATENIPVLGDDVAVCIDLSASMGSSVTGHRPGATSVTSCRDVAALIAASVARTNKNATVVAWASTAQMIRFNSRDSVMTNSRKFAGVNVGYGTNAELAIQILNRNGWKGKFVIVVSDNQSWLHRGRGLAREWDTFKRQNKDAKLVNINIQHHGDVLAVDDQSVLNVGGFSDSVFDVMGRFYESGDTNFVNVIKSVEL